VIKDPLDTVLQKHYIKLPYGQENFRSLAAEANTQHWTHLDYLARLVEGEAAARQNRAVLRRVKAVRFPVIKTLDTFRWDLPKKINRLHSHDLFRLSFIDKKANVIFLGLCGLGKSHLATALGYAAPTPDSCPC
jgi:DNA replication protein DnaC